MQHGQWDSVVIQHKHFDLWLPQGRPRATVLYLHGGGFRKGDRGEPFLPDLSRILIPRGFALASGSYRLGATMADLPREDRPHVRRMMAASGRSGLRLSSRLYGPAFVAALFDASDVIRDVEVASDGAPIVILGMSAGGILGLSLVHPPKIWEGRLARPSGVLAVSAAMVQPWCLRAGGPPSVMLHGSLDRIIPLADARLAGRVAAERGARLSVIETGEPGHVRQLELLLTGRRADGRPWLHLLMDMAEESAGLPLDDPACLP